MLSAVEVELEALYINRKLGMQRRHTLMSMGHQQPLIPMQTDNSTMYGVVSNKIIPKATKAMEMHFHWLRDLEQWQQFWFYCQQGKTNHANYWTKHHPADHHQKMHQVHQTNPAKLVSNSGIARVNTHVQQPKNMVHSEIRTECQHPEKLQGCAGIPNRPNPNMGQRPYNSIKKVTQTLPHGSTACSGVTTSHQTVGGCFLQLTS